MINSGGRNVKIREKDISLLCKLTREIFMEQPVFLELEAPIKICGKLSLKKHNQATCTDQRVFVPQIIEFEINRLSSQIECHILAIFIFHYR